MLLLKKIFLTLGFLIISGVAMAQYTGPSSYQEPTTVAEVLNNAQRLDRQDIVVKLRGFIVMKINDEDFWFEDATGRIRIEIDKKNLPTRPFDEKTEVIIVGEVDYNLLNGTEIEVDEILFASDEA